MTNLSLNTMWQSAQALGRADFLTLPSQRISYADQLEAIRLMCGYFDAAGLNPGDRVAICSTHDHAVVTSFLAALLHGLVPVNLSTGTKADRGVSILRSTEARLLICDAPIKAGWGAEFTCSVPAERGKRSWFGRSKAVHWLLDGDAPSPAEPRLPDDREALAYLLFTSGSTAAPTGVELTLGNLLANLDSVGRVTQLQSGDRMFNDLVMAHTDGLIHGPVLAFARGASVVRAGGMQLSRLEDWLNTIRREGCTHFISVPFVWSMIHRLGAHDDYFDGPEMKMLITSAARIDPKLWEQIETRFGKPLVNEYGMTETVMAACHAGDFPEMGTKGTLGRVAHCDARIEPTDPAVPTEGELQLKGPAIARGYWKNPERNATSFTSDGWLKTGDIVRLRPDGSYDLLGRFKSIINSGGMNIHPDEINEALESHPGVSSVATVGLPDDDFGEVAVSAVELSGAADPRALIEHARAGLEPIKVPKRVVVLTEIPRTESGKPRLEDLKTLLMQLDADGVPEAAAPGAPVDASLALVTAAAARVFACDAADLSARSTQDDVAGWDSFSQLNLFLAVEEKAGVRLPSRRLTSVRTLGDLAELLGDCRP